MAGIYIHIPLCKQRCYYCDFYSTRHLDRAGDYVRAVVAEARLRAGELGGEAVRTLYVGGGTPSVLPLDILRELVAGVGRAIDLTHVQEFTVEVNPDDVTPALVDALAGAGVNRVSMGVQSFVDEELRAVNRRHTAAQAVEAVRLLREGGIGNVSIDLIYGLPGQTLASLNVSLDAALALDVQHISAYNLSYEEGTPLWRMRQRGEVTEAGDELCVAMYDLVCRRLREEGFEHYEISNYARPGYHSRHNSAYWDGTPYLGLGAAAHSYDGRMRRYNPADLVAYIETIERGATAFVEEPETRANVINDTIMVRLRTTRGLDLNDFEQRFGDDGLTHLMSAAKQYIENGQLTLDDRTLRLAESAIMLSDAIIADLFVDEE